MNYWLVKSEPDSYSWDMLVRDGEAVWDGVRNFQARSNLKKMKKGDLVLFYHSNVGLEVVGVARVSQEFFPDPTAEGKIWVAVKLEPVRPLERPVKLSEIKQDPRLKDIILAKQSRLSVVPLEKEHFDRILALKN